MIKRHPIGVEDLVLGLKECENSHTLTATTTGSKNSQKEAVEKLLLLIGMISYLQRSRWSYPLLCFPYPKSLLVYMYLSQLMSTFTKLSKSALSFRMVSSFRKSEIQQSHMYSLIHWFTHPGIHRKYHFLVIFCAYMLLSE